MFDLEGSGANIYVYGVHLCCNVLRYSYISHHFHGMSTRLGRDDLGSANNSAHPIFNESLDRDVVPVVSAAM